MLPRLMSFETLEGSPVPDDISPESVDGSEKSKRRFKTEKFCITCIEFVFKFLS